MRKLLLLACLLCSFAVIFAQDRFNGTELLLSFMVFCEGDSTPPKENVKYITEPEEAEKFVKRFGYEQVTPLGLRRAYTLGLFYTHDNREPLLGEIYSENNIYLRSIDSTRHKMSMLTFLHLLYPPIRKWNTDLNWTPVPYTTVPKEDDPFMALENCPVLMKALKERREGFYPQMLKFQKFLDFVTRENGAKFNVTEKPLYCIDIMNAILSQPGLGIPTDEDFFKYQTAAATAEAYDILFDDNKYTPYLAGVLLHEFIEVADRIVAGEDVNQRVRVYAVGKENVAALSRLLGLDTGILYGPMGITIELRKEIATGKIFVSLWYNAPYSLDSNSFAFLISYYVYDDDCIQGNYRGCYYDKFVEIKKKYAWDYNTWKAKCHASEED